MSGSCIAKRISSLILLLAVALAATACKKEAVSGDSGPKPGNVVTTGDMALVTVDKPDQFPLVEAQSYDAAPELDVTGTVFPDIAREVPVISLASGRVVDIKAPGQSPIVTWR